jgi:hypothetical protein
MELGDSTEPSQWSAHQVALPGKAGEFTLYEMTTASA